MITIWIAIIPISAISLIFGGLLGYASRRFKVEVDPIIEQINAILPQSQCGQCGYSGCQPYAEAIVNNGEAINKCAPGSEQTILKLASLLNLELQLVDRNEISKVSAQAIAWIDESKCIGCTKCIQVCPVDAIIGTINVMHTVLSDICTGCNLCVSPCPINCIEMHSVAVTTT